MEGKTCWHKETNHLQPSQFFFSPFTHCRRRRRLLDMKHLGRSASTHIHTQHVHFPSRIPHASRDLPHTFLCDSIQPCFLLLLLLDSVCIRHVFQRQLQFLCLLFIRLSFFFLFYTLVLTRQRQRNPPSTRRSRNGKLLGRDLCLDWKRFPCFTLS